MTKAQSTPTAGQAAAQGWTFDPDGECTWGRESGLFGYGIFEGRTLIAVAMPDAEDGDSIARKIAAAPDLASALQEAIDLIKSFHGEPGWDIYYEHSPEMNRLRTTLAMAGAA